MSNRLARAKRIGQQFAALPFREVGGETQVLLVTSRESGRWILPKGWAEKGMSGAELAAKEAYEEAGIRGRAASRPVGSYSYLKKMPDGRELPCTVGVFPLEVEGLEKKFPEKGQRRRGWFNLAQAALQVEEEGLVLLLLRLAAPDAQAPGRDIAPPPSDAAAPEPRPAKRPGGAARRRARVADSPGKKAAKPRSAGKPSGKPASAPAD